ncbi:MAG TPA: SRPBCC domain-containing protein [Baekduia sp.]|uniref:SRPBCC domain-containing protein n=1 Tax=Baekduia sp. TaxID=2600305 RepID=UPI002D766CB5|nr:SRPBCC domain-containing protein [Baekduia sp.]HET6507652.1 SRPBCC domain-containing protein [Baekduia sp.]
MELHEEIGAVRRETVLDAPRDEVWARIASPEGLASWLADEVALDDVAPGASGTVVEDGVERRVEIEEVEDGRRVALSWCADDGEPSLVELTLDDVEDDADADAAAGPRTRMVVVELPLVTLRVASLATLRAASSAARGPRMAALAA